MSATDSERARDAYFRAIETTFIRLRGAPLLLSPTDWQTAREWHREGIPLEVVVDVLESVFAGVRERDAQRRISSLRYCAPAVEETWREIQDLNASGDRSKPEPIDVAARLRNLAAGLVLDLPALESVRAELSEIEGPAELVEKRLEELDVKMLEAVDRELDAETRAEITRRAEKALARALEGLDPERRDADLQAQLYRQFLRRQLKLPTLSLFSGRAGSESG